MRSSLALVAFWATVIPAVGFALTGLLILIAPYYGTQLWWEARAALFWSVPLYLVIVAAIAGAAALDDGDDAIGVGLWALAVLGVIGSIGWWVAHSYQTDRAYAASIVVTDDPLPALKTRTPYNVSAAQVRANLGDIPGDIQDTSYVPDLESFTTAVERRGAFTGYQTLLTQRIGADARNTPSRCDFAPTADRRLGGIFGHSLERLINTTQRGVNWSYSDAYGFCRDGIPHIVIPLKQQDGVLLVVERPAGVALYNGASGALTIHATADGIPGPSYPLTLAADQRESSVALGDFWDWVADRVGYELPDETDAINSDNSAEFVLATTGGGQVFATPLTGRGSATAISAVSTLDAHAAAGEWAPLRIHRMQPVWLSPTAITDRVRADFGDVFAVNRTADIFELVPTDGDRWTATIGTPQNLLYRVTGVGDLSLPPCLLTLAGDVVRCGSATSSAAPGVAIGAGPAGPGVAPAPASSDLDGLTDEQLVDLIARANREAADRLREGSGG